MSTFLLHTDGHGSDLQINTFLGFGFRKRSLCSLFFGDSRGDQQSEATGKGQRTRQQTDASPPPTVTSCWRRCLWPLPFLPIPSESIQAHRPVRRGFLWPSLVYFATAAATAIIAPSVRHTRPLFFFFCCSANVASLSLRETMWRGTILTQSAGLLQRKLLTNTFALSVSFSSSFVPSSISISDWFLSS